MVGCGAKIGSQPDITYMPNVGPYSVVWHVYETADTNVLICPKFGFKNENMIFQGQVQGQWPWNWYQKMRHVENLKKGHYSISVSTIVYILIRKICKFRWLDQITIAVGPILEATYMPNVGPYNVV